MTKPITREKVLLAASRLIRSIRRAIAFEQADQHKDERRQRNTSRGISTTRMANRTKRQKPRARLSE